MGGEHVRVVGSAAADLLPQIVLDAAEIKLGFEHDAQALTLRIIIDAGQVERLRVVGASILWGGLDGPLPAAKLDEVADFEIRD